MSGTPSRRDLLAGALSGRTRPVRPPWSVPESNFSEKCAACDDCVAACPEKIVVKGRGGLPEVDFGRGACTLCGLCVDSCPEKKMLFIGRERLPWSILPEFAESCLSTRGTECRVCGERCEHRAIRFRLQVGGRAHPELTISACTGCGGCVAVCPVGAITMEHRT